MTTENAGLSAERLNRPEERVRQAILSQLRQLGWADMQLRWKPEWRIPDTPSDLTKRERGQKYATCGTADLVAFADKSGEWHALQVIFEFKAPNIDKGRSQLIRYLSNEPMAKMGFWTNGDSSLAIYKRHNADWRFVEGAQLPRPEDSLSSPPQTPPTWNTLITPTEAELTGALKRIVVTTVVSDPNVSRREDQLRELLNLMLVKLESDSHASRPSNSEAPVSFRLYGDESNAERVTSRVIRDQYQNYFEKQRTRIFNVNDRNILTLTDRTIFFVVAELAPYRILGDQIDLLAKAFQIFRTSALKSGEGQYLTPLRIVRPAIMALEITSDDKVIDPACGTGSFLAEALRQVANREFIRDGDTHHLVRWANESLYGIDKDDIGVKLTRAIMVAMRDGSTHVLLGDALRVDQWASNYPGLSHELGKAGVPYVHEQFTVVVTNPPFGVELKMRAPDCKAAAYSISNAAAMKGTTDYTDLEIGLIYLELAHRLLRLGGRVGIILPETYFFSYTYRWLAGWLDGRFTLRGMLNIPMEAFEEFCRAKTNFYIFEKTGYGMSQGNLESANVDL